MVIRAETHRQCPVVTLAYRDAMEQQETCALCGDPIDVGEAWLEADDEGTRAVAHSGCVYRDEEPDARQRWMVPDA